MDCDRRWRVVLIGHSYIRRVGEYMQSSGRRNLMLSGVDVTVFGYGGTTVARLSRGLSVIPPNADVIYLHVGENDYERQQPRATAQAIVNLATDLVYVHGARCFIISELARFPVHRTDWCIRVNLHLRQLAAELSAPIRHWRQRRGLCNQRSIIFGRDSVVQKLN